MLVAVVLGQLLACGAKTTLGCDRGSVERDGRCLARDGGVDGDADGDTDSDGDGDGDAGFDPCTGVGLPCYDGPPGTDGVGVCATGRLVCESGRLQCAGWVGPSAEVCNEVDDDCDTQTDEPGCLPASGCADGEREAFVDEVIYPDIAGCAGGWDQPGIYDVVPPACAREAGDDGASPNGTGCNVEDLCAEGFHVCAGAHDVADHSPDGCAGATGEHREFWATRQSGPGCAQCATGHRRDCTGNDCESECARNAETTNDIFGCGTLGDRPAMNCLPLDTFSNELCESLGAPWSCGRNGEDEARNVIKPDPDGGGVVCCRD